MSLAKGFELATESLNLNTNIENRLETKSKFEILEILGHGGFSMGFHVKHMETGEK